MIKIEVDEALAYDMLSILEVKYEKTQTEESYENYKKMFVYINSQVEQNKDILFSAEYLTLCLINEKMFDYIDEMKKNPSIEDGVWVDQQNYKRFLAKKALQEKFFPDKKLTEQKIGYGK